MRIEHSSGPTCGATARSRRRQSVFSMPGEVAPTEQEVPAGAASDAAPVVSVIVVGQPEIAGDGAEAELTAARHGEAMLKALSGLQLASLDYPTDDARGILAGLAASSGRAVANPGLDAVLQAIAARAAVELARSA